MKEGAPAEPRSAQRSADIAAGGAAPVTNFEYEDNEWDVGIGDLIIDLDADIEKNLDSAPGGSAPPPPPSAGDAAAPASAAAKMGVKAQHSSSMEKGLKMKIKRTSKPGRSSEAKHEIVHSDGVAAKAGVTAAAAGAAASADTQAKAAKVAGKRAGVHKRDRREKEPPVTVKVEKRENGVSEERERGEEGGERSGSAESEEAVPSPPAAKRTKPDTPTQVCTPPVAGGPACFCRVRAGVCPVTLSMQRRVWLGPAGLLQARPTGRAAFYALPSPPPPPQSACLFVYSVI